MQQFDYSKRKNATDMAMTVDAMELLYTRAAQCLWPRVVRLRLHPPGHAPAGQGVRFMALVPPDAQAFVNACSRFLYLESLVSEEVPSATPCTQPDH